MHQNLNSNPNSTVGLRILQSGIVNPQKRKAPPLTHMASQAPLELTHWVSLYVNLERDPASASIVQFIKLLYSLGGFAEVSILLNEIPDVQVLGRCPPENSDDIFRHLFPFLHRGAEYTSLMDSALKLPFISALTMEGWGEGNCILCLDPKFYGWLKIRIRANSAEDTYWAIISVLCLHRCTPSPLVKSWTCNQEGSDAVNLSRNTHHALKHLVRVCESYQEADFTMLKPELRLYCLLFYINWNGLACHIKHSMHTMDDNPRSYTQLILEKLAGAYLKNPLILAIVNAEIFLSTIGPSYKDHRYKFLYKWQALAEAFTDTLENLNMDYPFSPSPEPFAVDTLVAFVFKLTRLSSCGPPTSLFQSNHGPRDEYSKEAAKEISSENRKITEEAYKFCSRIPSSRNHAHFRAIILAYRRHRLSILDEPSEWKHVLQYQFPGAMKLLPCIPAMCYLFCVLKTHKSCRDWGAYASALCVAFRTRPDIVHCIPEGFAYTAPPFCLAPDDDTLDDRNIIPLLFEHLLQFAGRDAETIAAHYFLSMGRFPRRFNFKDCEMRIAAFPAGIWRIPQWHSLIKPFLILSQVYYNSKAYLPAAILANGYMSLARLAWVQWHRSCSSNEQIGLKFLTRPYTHCGDSIKHAIRILTVSLRTLNLLGAFSGSSVAEHVDTLLFERFPNETTPPGSQGLVWVAAEPSEADQTQGTNRLWRTNPWLPEQPLSVDDASLQGWRFYQQLRGWFQLIDADDALRDARRQLVGMVAARECVTQRILYAEERMGLPKWDMTSKGTTLPLDQE